MTPPDSSLLDILAGRVHDLGQYESFTAGRSRDVDLPLADPSCSRRHFRIVVRGGEYHLEALSGASPTFCDGRPVAGAVPLRDGAVIRAGSQEFRFCTGTPAVPRGLSQRPTVLGPGDVDSGGARPLPMGPIELQGGRVLGRRPGASDFVLPH